MSKGVQLKKASEAAVQFALGREAFKDDFTSEEFDNLESNFIKWDKNQSGGRIPFSSLCYLHHFPRRNKFQFQFLFHKASLGVVQPVLFELCAIQFSVVLHVSANTTTL